MSKPRVIAFYLPQYHPIPENDEWWGKGFTEWTNVAKARPLFRGHYQPHIPADLGFYDLRVPEVRKQQAELAREAGIEGFCYYHYWFGHKNTPRELMQMPFNEVVKMGEPNFPFCLCWANHSFFKKDWSADVSYWNETVLVEQNYYGIEDYTEHFYSLLDAFRDERYIKVNGKLLFVIFRPNHIPDIQNFINCWNELADKNGIPRFAFIAYCIYPELEKGKIDNENLFDAKIYHKLPLLTNDVISFKNNMLRYTKKILATLFRIPIFKMNYEKASTLLIPNMIGQNQLIPELISGFDHSPRSGNMRLILHKYTPQAFEKHVKAIFSLLKSQNSYNNMVFLKSWNEWGEGNYLEPDLKYGHQFLDVLKHEIEKFEE